MNGMITTTKYDDLSEVMEKIHNFKVTGVVEKQHVTNHIK